MTLTDNMNAFSWRAMAACLAAAVTLLLSCAPTYLVQGPQGGIAADVVYPDGFDPQTDSCHMVILMHGIFSSKDYPPMPGIAKALAREGIASVAIDFGGHGHSQGKKVNMTIEKELQEARAVWDHVSALGCVKGISLLGHSQGGVIASMLAGRLAAEGNAPEAVILMAPGAVIKEACQAGRFFGNEFDPADPPAFIKCFGFYTVGREYMLTSQELDIYGESSRYQGPVCIVHGTRDGTVPLWCSERYDSVYTDSQLHLIEGENHLMVRHLSETLGEILPFLSSVYSQRD